ncbi:MAG: hypothetical protein ACD_75C02638G0003 [uncultured bacterium]|nr:MAG: hypothetical protein ACD_75C02638G0003 [uncultured bacterium]
MLIPPYLQPKTKKSYLLLLNFAKITERLNEDYFLRKDTHAVLEALNLFSKSIDPALRPILPLIYRNTDLSGLRDQLHPNVQKLLRDHTLRLITEEMANRQWLIKHLEIFQQANIPVILLKGLAFAGSLYPVNAPRLGVDLDLLVSQDNFEPACTLLGKTMVPLLLSTKRVATHDTLFERVFSPREGTRPIVELHRGLTNPSIFNIDQQTLWAASRKHPAYNSESVRILSPEDTLLHLAVHAFRDLNFCTHNILDAHEVWCQWQPDQEKLLERATQWGARKVLFCLLTNCRAILETPVPGTVLNRLQPANVTNWINKKILQSTTLYDAAHTSLRYRLMQLTSQLTLPDHPLRGLKFQLTYARTRLNDWFIHRRRQHQTSS